MTDRPVPLGIVPPCTQVDPNLFFAEDPDLGGKPRIEPWIQRLLAEMCADCPARTQCRDFAAERGLPGWWGGTTDAQRRRMFRA